MNFLGPALAVVLASCHTAPEASPEPVDPIEPQVGLHPSIELDAPCPEGMALVDGGTFTDVQWQSLSARFDPSGLHRDLEPFCLALHEVTNADFRDCANAGACVEGRDFNQRYDGHRPCIAEELCESPFAELPVQAITEQGANAYCRFRGGRVPSVSEWFWAAMGGTENRQYPWGNAAPDPTRLNVCDESCRLAGCEATEGSERRECLRTYSLFLKGDDGFASSAPVGSFPAGVGRWGQLDMLGNAAEYASLLGSLYTCGGSSASRRVNGELADEIELSEHNCRFAPDGIRCTADPHQP